MNVINTPKGKLFVRFVGPNEVIVATDDGNYDGERSTLSFFGVNYVGNIHFRYENGAFDGLAFEWNGNDVRTVRGDDVFKQRAGYVSRVGIGWTNRDTSRAAKVAFYNFLHNYVNRWLEDNRGNIIVEFEQRRHSQHLAEIAKLKNKIAKLKEQLKTEENNLKNLVGES
jgi:hypothetical protein